MSSSNRRWVLRACPPLWTILALCGCGSSTASVQVSVVPNPAPLAAVEPSPHGLLTLYVTFTATFRETAGVDATIDTFQLEAFDTASGQIVGQAIPPTDSHLPMSLPAHGTATYRDSWSLDVYGFQGAPENPVPGPLLFRISTGLTDANDHQIQESMDVPELLPRFPLPPG